jgi:hypothetical protein
LRTFNISHCLVVEADEKCRLQFSPAITLIVIVCSAIKVACLFLAAQCDQDEVLLTIGDALSSFLSRPDETTKGGCFMTRSTVLLGSQSMDPDEDQARSTLTNNGRSERLDTIRTGYSLNKMYPETLAPGLRWLRAPGRRRWALFITL